MSKYPFPYQFIAIEGNIGAGKTTLCQMLAKDYNCRLILEQFTDNPFLPPFYESPERYAFPVELFFMTERHKQLQEQLSQQELFQQSIISDYFFLKTLLFAKNNLQSDEYRLFQRLFNILNTTFPKPDILVYLHRPVDQLMENIQKRGRGYEKDISREYLLQIQNSYFDFFKNNEELPILILDVENADFIERASDYQNFIDTLQCTYPKGLNRLSL